MKGTWRLSQLEGWEVIEGKKDGAFQKVVEAQLLKVFKALEARSTELGGERLVRFTGVEWERFRSEAGA